MIWWFNGGSSYELFLSGAVALLGAIVWFLINNSSQKKLQLNEKVIFIWLFLLSFMIPDINKALQFYWIDVHSGTVFYLSGILGILIACFESFSVKSKSFWSLSSLAIFNHIFIDQIFR